MVSCSWKQTLGRFALDSSFEKYFDCYTDDIGKACLAYPKQWAYDQMKA